MLIPSIDLMEGKAVQLRQGKERVLTAPEDPVELARRFNRFGEVAVIDLDAALGRGDNLELIRRICQVADVRAGGGIRDAGRAAELLRAGARRLIIGTAATPELLGQLPRHRVMVALDHVQGEVVDQGWTRATGEGMLERAERLAPYCGSFLCTNVAEEGGMQGMDPEALLRLARDLPCPVTVAGGAATTEEVARISRMGLDVQVGMALYTGVLDPARTVVESLDWDKAPLLPTVVQDRAGQVLMLAYSSPESLAAALEQGRGLYFSRSRQEIWEKGQTSGHVQELLACRTDCDRDSLLFTVSQTGRACHRPSYSCFGERRFTLEHLFSVLRQRKLELPEGSYSARLFQDRKLLRRKILEEAFEAVTFEDRRELVWELADCFYFLSLLAVDEGIDFGEIIHELGGRER